VDQYESLYKALAAKKGKLVGFHMRLLNGHIPIFEVPSGDHEAVAAIVNIDVVSYNFEHYGNMEVPSVSRRSTKFYFQNSRLEPDDCYLNKRIPNDVIPRDLNYNPLPNIVLEVRIFRGL
jgi:Uma2 family endonuclease